MDYRLVLSWTFGEQFLNSNGRQNKQLIRNKGYKKSMRVNKDEIKIIKQGAHMAFGGDCKVYLFGSRTDDSLRGGDIDIYIETAATEELFHKKIKLLSFLHSQLGEQKIDVVVNNFTSSSFIHEVARQEGILL